MNIVGGGVTDVPPHSFDGVRYRVCSGGSFLLPRTMDKVHP